MNIEEFDWYADFNEKWPIVFFKNLFELSNDISTESNPTILSLTQNGVKVRDISNNEGQISASYENSAIAKVGDFVLNPMDLRSGSVAISEFEGVVSNAYFVFRPKKQQDFPCHPRFYEILFKWHYTTDIF